MIQEQTRLKVADNSGARSIMCIRVLGTKSKVARVGDVIRVSVKAVSYTHLTLPTKRIV